MVCSWTNLHKPRLHQLGAEKIKLPSCNIASHALSGCSIFLLEINKFRGIYDISDF